MPRTRSLGLVRTGHPGDSEVRVVARLARRISAAASEPGDAARGERRRRRWDHCTRSSRAKRAPRPTAISPPHISARRRRIVDDELDRLIAGGAAAISLEGAKAVGKRATAAEQAARTYLLEDAATREIVAAEPGLLQEDGPVLLDEWQHLPRVWDLVRRAVDAGAAPGTFLLTGSASAPHAGTHTGAGRILSVRLRPLSLAERGLTDATISLGELLAGGARVAGATDVGVREYAAEVAASGLPGIRPLDERVRQAQLRGYLERIVDRDVGAATGRTVRRPASLRRWISAYAAATATTASYETIRDAAMPGEADKPAQPTVQAYRAALERLYVLDAVPAWLPTRGHINELGAAPKHHLVDPALALAALGMRTDALLGGDEPGVTIPRDGSFLGALFESLVTLSVRVYAQANEAAVGHLRTHRGEHEIDLIVERPDGRVLAIETKLGATVGDGDVRHLHWLRDRLGDDLIDTVVVTTGPRAYRRGDGIAVVPAALLGP